MRRPTLSLIPSVAFAISCEGGADRTGLIVRDSAGTELVEMSGEFAANASGLVLREDLRIGTVEGPAELQFFRIAAIVDDADGFIYVADGGNHVVRKFTPDGEFVIEFGGEGEGPGRFARGPWYLSVSRDTIAVVDQLVHLFRLDGSLIDAIGPQLTNRGPYVWELEATRNGWFVGTRSATARGEGRGPFRDTTYIDEFDPTSGALGVSAFGYPLQPTYAMGPIRFIVSPILEPVPQHAMGPDGTIVFTRGAGYQIEVWSPLESFEGPGATMKQRITVEVPLLPIDETVIDLYLDAQREYFEGRPNVGEIAMSRKLRLEDIFELDTPEFRPVLGRILLSSTGEFMVERLDLDENPFRDEDPTYWDLIGEDGVIRGRFTTSERLTPRALSSHGLYGVLRDELDVQYVVRYQIEQAN